MKDSAQRCNTPLWDRLSKKGKSDKGKRISNIEQGISNDEVRNAGSLELEDLIRRTVEQLNRAGIGGLEVL